MTPRARSPACSAPGGRRLPPVSRSSGPRTSDDAATDDLLTPQPCCCRGPVVTPFLGRYIAAVFEGERTLLSPVLRPVERAIYRVAGVDEPARAGLAGVRGRAARCSASSRSSCCTCSSGSRAACRSTRPASAPVPPEPRLQHGGQLRDQHELAELRGRVDDGPPDPGRRARGPELRVRRRSGMAIAIALTRGLVRRTSATIGNFWVDLTRGDALHPAADRLRGGARARLAGRAPRPGRARRRSPRSRARSRRSRSARSPRRSRSRSSAPTAAASSTPTRPIRSRTRTGSRTGSRCCSSSSSRSA